MRGVLGFKKVVIYRGLAISIWRVLKNWSLLEFRRCLILFDLTEGSKEGLWLCLLKAFKLQVERHLNVNQSTKVGFDQSSTWKLQTWVRRAFWFKKASEFVMILLLHGDVDENAALGTQPVNFVGCRFSPRNCDNAAQILTWRPFLPFSMALAQQVAPKDRVFLMRNPF